MRRGVGIAGLQRQVKAKEHYREVGTTIANTQISQVKARLEIFRDKLHEFAAKYKKEIRDNPTFRAHFQKMCADVGVDPLASNKGFWAELLGFGDFYYELGIQIVEICLSTKSKNGGLMALDNLKRQLELIRHKGTDPISEDDIVRAINSLKTLGSGFELVQVGERRMVQSVPRELNVDLTTVLSQAQATGFVTSRSIMNTIGWDRERTMNTLNHLIQEGLCWIDTQADPNEYWVPSFLLEE